MATTSDDEIAAAIIGELKPYQQSRCSSRTTNLSGQRGMRRRKLGDMRVLGPLVLRIEHTGSTAVPGLAAKSVIDMLLV